MLVRRRHRAREVVACPGVDVASLQVHDRRASRPARQYGPERGHVDGAIPVCGHERERAGPESQQAQRAVDRGMALLARHDCDSRAPGKPVALDVPSHVREDLVAGRGQAHRVGPWAPVTNPNDTSPGRPGSSTSQAPATSSTRADAGDDRWLYAGWSQPAIPPTGSAVPNLSPASNRHRGDCMHSPANPRRTWSIWTSGHNQVSRLITRISFARSGLRQFTLRDQQWP